MITFRRRSHLFGAASTPQGAARFGACEPRALSRVRLEEVPHGKTGARLPGSGSLRLSGQPRRRAFSWSSFWTRP
jgi:hypothetical protein